MTRKVSKKYQIPFDADGNQLHYPVTWNGSPIWKENYSFSDSLKINRLSTGRSAKYYSVVSISTGKKFTIFARDLIDIIEHAKIDRGIMTGTWTFVKRGQNYGVSILESDSEN